MQGVGRRPDFVLFRRDEKDKSHPLYIIEVKKPNSSKKLTDDLAQNFEQTRSICIDYGLAQTYGVLTDFKTWIFTRCDIGKEVHSVVNRSHQHDPPKMFEVSENFEVCDPFTLELNKEKLH